MKKFNIYDDFKEVHFIGIGGISMSGLAAILLDKGIKVSGSDMKTSKNTKLLESKGAKIYIGHSKENIKNPDLVVYTDAINKDNEELKEAINKDIISVDRGTFLGQFMQLYDNSIAVSGTHGKTTTTSILSVLLNETDFDPTILLGGSLKQINGNVRIGSKKLLITEACEYKANILKFHSTIGIVLNIDNDHLDCYENIDQIIEVFKGFVELIDKDGFLIANNDDENTTKILTNAKCNIRTFGEKKGSYYKISNINIYDNFTSDYELTINEKDTYIVKLNVLGKHNIIDSAAAIAASHSCGADIDYLIRRIEDYTGTWRRLERKGEYNGFSIIDDYAHHPTEIKASLKAIKSINKNKLWCIFQPHTFSRSIALLNDFSESFYDADKVILTDIFAAREEDWGNINSRMMVDKLKENGVDAIYIKEFEEIEKYIIVNADKDDIVLTMGAGNVSQIGDNILKKI